MEYMDVPNDGMRRAKQSLVGLSVGDAFGQQFFTTANAPLIASRHLPPGPWSWTDDTAQALCIFEALQLRGEIGPDLLATLLAAEYRRDPNRGYGGGAHQVLQTISAGTDWRVAAQALFGGQGSMGNGAAMRAAPIGAYFGADNLAVVVEQARRSAAPTHAHPEGAAGAIAVAVAAALVASVDLPAPALLSLVAQHTPAGQTHSYLVAASQLSLHHTHPAKAAELLGNGSQVRAYDTVPFALWCVARNLGNYEGALWDAVSGGGDIDTTCAIAGGVAACGTGSVPHAWVARREPLP